MFFFEDQKNARPYTTALPPPLNSLLNQSLLLLHILKNNILYTHQLYRGPYCKLGFTEFSYALVTIAKGDHLISRKQQTISHAEELQTTALPQKTVWCRQVRWGSTCVSKQIQCCHPSLQMSGKAIVVGKCPQKLYLPV